MFILFLAFKIQQLEIHEFTTKFKINDSKQNKPVRTLENLFGLSWEEFQHSCGKHHFAIEPFQALQHIKRAHIGDPYFDFISKLYMRKNAVNFIQHFTCYPKGTEIGNAQNFPFQDSVALKVYRPAFSISKNCSYDAPLQVGTASE